MAVVARLPMANNSLICRNPHGAVCETMHLPPPESLGRGQHNPMKVTRRRSSFNCHESRDNIISYFQSSYFAFVFNTIIQKKKISKHYHVVDIYIPTLLEKKKKKT